MKQINLITIETILEMQANEEKFVLIDVRGSVVYEQEHIPDAINIPLEKIQNEIAQYADTDQKVVVYCGSYACASSTSAARLLLLKGYEHVYDFKGGIKLWDMMGLRTQES